MASRDFPIVGDTLTLGFRFQRHWDNSMALAFFFGELGAGIFLAGALYGSLTCMVVGVLTTAILKTYFHITHMGVPGRAWRAILRPDRSWISRGLISIAVFIGAALLHILILGTSFIDASGAFAQLVSFIAILAALLVMTYHGFAIADSSAISFWNTGLMPISSLAYSALAGVMVLQAIDPAAGAAQGALPSAHGASLLLLVLTILILLAFLNSANRGSPGARKSLQLLLRDGPYVKWFYGVQAAVGLLLPLLLLNMSSDLVFTVLAAIAFLAGYLAFRILVFKVGLYDPIISFARTT